jgi:hypothetical protein
MIAATFGGVDDVQHCSVISDIAGRMAVVYSCTSRSGQVTLHHAASDQITVRPFRLVL